MSETRYVDASRLNDIVTSYSAKTIAEGKGCKKPFREGHTFHVCLSCSSEEASVYRLMGEKGYQGVALSYQERKDMQTYDEANGFWHGVKTSYRGAGYVLVGPPITYMVQPGEDQTPEPVKVEAKERNGPKPLKGVAGTLRIFPVDARPSFMSDQTRLYWLECISEEGKQGRLCVHRDERSVQRFIDRAMELDWTCSVCGHLFSVHRRKLVDEIMASH
jgi:hypothetical protein